MQQQWVLITGASSGIGKEFAQLYAENKYNLVIVARSEKTLSDLAAQLSNQYSIQAIPIALDLSIANAATKLIDELKRRSLVVDILINNAGFGLSGPFVSQDLAEIKNMIAVNITALTELTYGIGSQMKERRKGKILNIASIAAFLSNPNFAVYAATKSYVLYFSEAISEELAPFGVTVTALCPGVTQTHFIERAKLERALFYSFRFAMNPRKVAEIGYKSLERGSRIVICGWKNRIMIFLSKLTPHKLLLKITALINKNY